MNMSKSHKSNRRAVDKIMDAFDLSWFFVVTFNFIKSLFR